MFAIRSVKAAVVQILVLKVRLRVALEAEGMILVPLQFCIQIWQVVVPTYFNISSF